MLFRNTFAQSGSALAGYLFSFILAPIMIARLGLEAFGVWAVTGALATYAGLLDLGIGRSLSRFIAVFDAGSREERIRECVGLGLLAVACVGVLAALIGLLLTPVLVDQLGVLNEGEMRIVVLSSVAILTFGGIDSIFGAVGIGKLEMVPPNIATFVGQCLNFGFSLIALALSSSLVVYALANAAAVLLGIVPMFLAMRYVWYPPYAVLPSMALAREVLSFSVKNQIGWFADLINLQTDKLIIAAVVDVRAVAIYEIASRVVLGVRSAAILTFSAMIPTAAAEIVKRGKEVIADFYSRYTLRSSAIAFPLFVVVSITAPFLLVAWLGDAPGDSAALVPWLALSFLANTTTGVGSTIAIAAGHPGFVSLNALLIAGLNVGLTLVLGPLFGLWGVVAGTFVALTLGSMIFTVRFLRLFGLPTRDFLNAVLPTGVLAIGLALPLVPVALVLGVPDDRLSALVPLVAVGAAYTLPYWFLASRSGFLPERLRMPRFRAA